MYDYLLLNERKIFAWISTLRSIDIECSKIIIIFLDPIQSAWGRKVHVTCPLNISLSLSLSQTLSAVPSIVIVARELISIERIYLPNTCRATISSIVRCWSRSIGCWRDDSIISAIIDRNTIGTWRSLKRIGVLYTFIRITFASLSSRLCETRHAPPSR